MTSSELLRSRAPHQLIVGPACESAEMVVGHFGSIQSQDFAMAKWAIGRRSGLTESAIDRAFGQGRFLRTHILRPTWHFILPQDLTWVMSITAPRIHRQMHTFNKTIDLSEAQMDQGAEIIVAALTAAATPLTRAQLATSLSEAGLPASGSRLAHLAMHAELLALTCSGPIVGKHHTYILAPETVTSAPRLSEDEALARLATTYVRGHGPSQPADLSWWSSLTLTSARRAFELAGLEPILIDGLEYFRGPDTLSDHPPPHAALMPAFDECISYVVKPVDRQRFADKPPDLARGGGLLFLDGLIAGTWRRKSSASKVVIDVTARGQITRRQASAIEAESIRFGDYLGLRAHLRFGP